MLKSLATFAGTLAVAVTFWLSPVSRPVRETVEWLLARTSGAFLGLLGSSVAVSGSTVVVQGFAAEVIPACTGLFTTSILVAAVLAYPCAWRSKLIGIALSVLGLLALNWLRIVSLLLIGAYWPAAFDVAHLLIWRSLVLFAAVLLWLFWVRRFAGSYARHAPARAHS